MQQQSKAYDRAITIFSPDGRLFQVEYAREAVKRGSVAVGMVYDNGALIGTVKSNTNELVKPESVEKVFKIDDHIGATTSGLVADARVVVDHARVEAQKEKATYEEPVKVKTLTEEICDLKQMYTQYGGTRPFGTSLLVAGIDRTGARLFETDPSGAFSEVYASAIGSKKKEVEEIFKEGYDEEIEFDDALELAVKGLSDVTEEEVSHKNVHISYIDKDEKEFKRLPSEELENRLEKE